MLKQVQHDPVPRQKILTMQKFNFKIEKKIPNALGRAGIISTPHGDILTPSFVPVGTKGAMKGVTPEMMR